MKSRHGATLVEVILYVVLVIGLGGMFMGILNTSTNVGVRETTNAKVSSQLSFAMNTIERLVRSSSNVEASVVGDNMDTTAIEVAYLKLRMPETADDPTCISLVDNDGAGTQTQGALRITKGAGSFPEKCKDSSTSDNITGADVTVPLSQASTLFKILSNSPAHDIVEIALTVESFDDTPESHVSRTLRSAISRVNAATFDSDLLPASTVSNLGSLQMNWNDLFLKNLKLSGTISQPANFDGANRGFFVVATPAGDTNNLGPSCDAVCASHLETGSCVLELALMPNAGKIDFIPNSCAGIQPPFVGALCFCQ